MLVYTNAADVLPPNCGVLAVGRDTISTVNVGKSVGRSDGRIRHFVNAWKHIINA